MKNVMMICMVVVFAVLVSFAQAEDGESGDCITIAEGILLTSGGEVITVKKDLYGYNYQARLYDGLYCNYDRIPGCDPVGDEGVKLLMKWNDAWLSNKDCDGDLLLDRHYGHDSYIGSGAWLTNVQAGSYIGEDGEEYKWNYFCKIIAVPENCTFSDEDNDGNPDDYVDIWFNEDGTEIGPAIWGSFAITQQVYNDMGTGEHGQTYLSPAYPGLGNLTSEVTGSE